MIERRIHVLDRRVRNERRSRTLDRRRWYRLGWQALFLIVAVETIAIAALLWQTRVNSIATDSAKAAIAASQKNAYAGCLRVQGLRDRVNGNTIVIHSALNLAAAVIGDKKIRERYLHLAGTLAIQQNVTDCHHPPRTLALTSLGP